MIGMKKKTMWLAVAAAILLLLAVPVVTVLLSLPASRPSQTVKAYDEAADCYGKQLQEGSYTFHLKMEAPFDALSVAFADYGEGGSASVALYPCEQESQASPSGEAIASAVTQVRGETVQTLQFRDCPAGDYLLEVGLESGAVALLAYDGTEEGTTVSGADCFLNGQDVEDFDIRLQVNFTETRETYFTAVNPVTVAQASVSSDKYTVKPGTWVFTDALGRVSLTNKEVGDPKDGKTVTMFFWDWHINDGALNRMSKIPVNVQKLMEQHPEIQNDYNSSLWGAAGSHSYYWNESIYGFYASNDRWVAQKQGELLANAGVDAIFFDNTNGSFTWSAAYTPIFETFASMQKNGVNVPKISFMLPFAAGSDSANQASSLYNSIYASGKWSSLWYRLEGKPFLMAHSSNFSSTLRNFFSFRAGHGTYTAGTSTTKGSTYWGWLTIYPQPVFGTGTNLTQMTVSPAQNYTYRNTANSSYPIIAMNGKYVMGRSYTKASGGSAYDANGKLKNSDSSLYGYNFAEQFEYALSKNPDVIMVTGWNEWCADRQTIWPDSSGYNQTVNALPDTFNDEYSRDIEPTKGKLKDNYYYQMVNFIRRYKGTEAIEPAGAAKSIDIFGEISQWDNVGPYFAAYRDNIGDRSATGMGGKYYSETSGRNDIIGAQVSRDEQFLYFLVECADDITSYTGRRWMTLYLDTDQSNQGWESFDYVINKQSPTSTEAVLERFTGNGYNTEEVCEVRYAVDGRYLQIRVPKSALGLSGYDFTVNFTWTDNVHDEGNVNVFSGDIMDFYISGDVAPGGRFKYSYISTRAAAVGGYGEEDLLNLSPWYRYDYSQSGGLRMIWDEYLGEFAQDLRTTGWTRTATLYVPEKAYTANDVIGVFAMRGDEEGEWYTAINYNLGTGLVESGAPDLYQSVSRTKGATGGWLFFTDTFDGTTQKVYLNGSLIYSATVTSAGAGLVRSHLLPSGQTTLFFGTPISVGEEKWDDESQYLQLGVIVWNVTGYSRVVSSATVSSLYRKQGLSALGDPTEFSYSYDQVLSTPWYQFDYRDTAEGTLVSTRTVPTDLENPMEIDGWTKLALYHIPSATYAANDRLLVFGIKSSGASGNADLGTGIVYSLRTGTVTLSAPEEYRITYQKALPVTGTAFFVNTFSGGIMKVWLNGELVLEAIETEDHSLYLSSDGQTQIFLNVYAANGARRTAFSSQYAKYGVTMDYSIGYGHAANGAAVARLWEEHRATLPEPDSGNYEEVLSASWYAFSETKGYTAPAVLSVTPFSGKGWTHETVLYIPEDAVFGSADFVSLTAEFSEDDGLWIAGIRYNLSTGVVSTANSGVFPFKGQTKIPQKARGTVHFLETFDGTTQRVWVNGELAYEATVSGVTDPLTDGRNQILLGGYVSAGITATEATVPGTASDVFAEYGVYTVSAKAYAVAADEQAVARFRTEFLKE